MLRPLAEAVGARFFAKDSTQQRAKADDTRSHPPAPIVSAAQQPAVGVQFLSNLESPRTPTQRGPYGRLGGAGDCSVWSRHQIGHSPFNSPNPRRIMPGAATRKVRHAWALVCGDCGGDRGRLFGLALWAITSSPSLNGRWSGDGFISVAILCVKGKGKTRLKRRVPSFESRR